MSGFKITYGSGFHVTFENGWTVSVQFGGGTYCDNRNYGDGTTNLEPPQSSTNAEVAAWDAKGSWHRFEDGDTVKGYMTPAEVLAFTNEIAAKEQGQ
jgi:hypothetical protein